MAPLDHRVERIANRHAAVAIDLDRGAELIHLGPDSDTNVLAYYDWESPLPVERSMLFGDDRQDWLSSYRGGWQELFPNAGLACKVGRVPLPFHGEASIARWRLVDRTATSVTTSCPARLPLVVQRRIDLADDSPGVLITGEVRNESDLDVDFLWGHHPAYLSPPGTQIDLPDGVEFEVGADADPASAHVFPGAKGTWPHAERADGDVEDLSQVDDRAISRVIFLRGASWYALRPANGPGIAVTWDTDTFPVVWMWQSIGGSGFPTYGRAQITALEPNRAAPGDGLAAAIERGEALRVGPRGTVSTWLRCTMLPDGAGRVVDVRPDGQVTYAS